MDSGFLTFETERLRLRPWRTEDAEDMYAYAKNPQVGPNAGWKPHESLDESRAILSKWTGSADSIEFAIEYKETGHVIGSVGISEDGRRPEMPETKSMGYVLSQEYWGRGLMTEAADAIMDYVFQALKVKLLTITHYPSNTRSRRVIEKCGFHYDGRLRRATKIYNGDVKDLCCYSMTSAEYYLRRAKKLGFSLALPEEIPMRELGAYWKEWGNSRMVPGASDRKGRSEEQWLEHVIAGRFYTRPQLVTSTLYFLRNSEGELVGSIDLRHSLNDGLQRTGGHIGYGIRPSCRGKKYAPCMLALVLEKARERGMARVLVTCVEENRASASTIEACGGVLENKVSEGNEVFCRYWIDI